MVEGLDEFEWDEAKRARNLAKHGIDFVDVVQIWRGAVLTRRAEYADEERYWSVGRLQDRTVTVVWTRRELRRRLISARMASRGERKDYSRCIERAAQGGAWTH